MLNTEAFGDEWKYPQGGRLSDIGLGLTGSFALSGLLGCGILDTGVGLQAL